MKVTVIIPTCSIERLPLLIQAVESIQNGTYEKAYPIIVVDGSNPLYTLALKELHHVSILLNKERVGWITSTNHILKTFDSDYYIYASDDLTFPPDCIENAMQTMQERFPDGNGLVTISKKNRCPFGLIGNKFVEHFPGRQVFCPDYRHYGSDTELKKFVMSSNLFAFPPQRESQVVHYRLNDETRRLARQVRNRDRSVHTERVEKGYLWGKNFNLVRRDD